MFRERMISLLHTTAVFPLLASAATNRLGRWRTKTPKVEVVYLTQYETFDDVARWRCR
jgi:hypothetical protein